MRHSVIAVIVMTVMLGVAPPVSATEIRVDMSNAWSSSQLNTCNLNSSLTDLRDFSTQTPTQIDFAMSGWTNWWARTDHWTAGTVSWVWDSVLADDLFYTNGSASATFSSVPGSHYRVEALSSMVGNTYTADISIGGVFADSNYQNIPGVNGDDFDARNDGRQTANWLIWSDVVPVGGEIRIDVVTDGSAGALNGIRLTEVPEPASMGLLALGGLALLKRRR